MLDVFQLQRCNQRRRNEFESGGTRPSRIAVKILFVVPLHFFGSKSTISRIGERFWDGQYGLVSFLFAVLLLTVSPCPMESVPMTVTPVNLCTPVCGILCQSKCTNCELPGQKNGQIFAFNSVFIHIRHTSNMASVTSLHLIYIHKFRWIASFGEEAMEDTADLQQASNNWAHSRGVHRHPRRRKMCHGNPRRTTIRKLRGVGRKIYPAVSINIY